MYKYTDESLHLLVNMSDQETSSVNINNNKNENSKEKFTTYGIISICFYIITFFVRISFIDNINTIDNAIKYFPKNDFLINNTIQSMSNYCLSKNKPCLEAFKNIQEDFVRKVIIAPHYKMASCIMPKCMSTVTSKIFSYLYDSDKYLKFDWKMNGVSSSHHINDFSDMENFISNIFGSSKNSLENWQLSVFIREPLDRFISAFIDKCYLEKGILPLGLFYPGSELCYGCNRNMSCYLTKQYTRSVLYSKSLQKVVGYEDQHTFPQNWFCNFGEYKDKFMIYKTTSDKEGKDKYKKIIVNMLEKQNVEKDKITFVKDVILKGQKNITDPVEIKLKEKKNNITNYKELPYILKDQLLSDPYMYKLFLSMYYNDYIVFNYPIPLPKYNDQN
uniref:Sulfotransferase domain-containing protein n=1 Tax=Strongyloides stercoralis TaxID=6248 RepID=A0A0K0E6T2_STRER